MKDFIDIDILNLFIRNSVLVNVFLYASISELIIYFGIKTQDRNTWFHIIIFAAYQLIIINITSWSYVCVGIISILTAILILILLNLDWPRNIIYKTRTNILANGWDSLGKQAFLNSPLLIRIITKDDKAIYGVFANKSNISFSSNTNGIFLEKAANIDENDKIEVNDDSCGIWINHDNIITIELIQKL